ncbi:MAG: hypothetical protein PHI97_08925 [Desulfobulbus sp.]|nr:hypothetical protein [Desulfobulbus sp.]
MNRAVILELHRKLPHEEVARLRYAEPNLFSDLRFKLAMFADDFSEEVRLAIIKSPKIRGFLWIHYITAGS